MPERSRTSSRERVSLAERQQMVDWITETVLQRGLFEKKSLGRDPGTRHIFSIRTANYGVILTNLTKLEVLAEPEILDELMRFRQSMAYLIGILLRLNQCRFLQQLMSEFLHLRRIEKSPYTLLFSAKVQLIRYLSFVSVKMNVAGALLGGALV